MPQSKSWSHSCLPVSSPFHDLFQWLDVILGVHGRSNDPRVYHIDFLEQVILELCMALLELDRPHHGSSGRFFALVAIGVVAGPDYGCIHFLKIVCEALLGSKNVNPSISPRFGSFNYLNKR